MEKDGKSSISKWFLKPSATACEDDLPVWPSNESSRMNLCEQIFLSKKGELRPQACDNECKNLVLIKFSNFYLS